MRQQHQRILNSVGMRFIISYILTPRAVKLLKPGVTVELLARKSDFVGDPVEN